MSTHPIGSVTVSPMSLLVKAVSGSVDEQAAARETLVTTAVRNFATGDLETATSYARAIYEAGIKTPEGLFTLAATEIVDKIDEILTIELEKKKEQGEEIKDINSLYLFGIENPALPLTKIQRDKEKDPNLAISTVEEVLHKWLRNGHEGIKGLFEGLKIEREPEPT